MTFDAAAAARVAGRQPKRLHELRAPAWERQPGETRRAFSLFCIYRDLPLGRRTLEACAKAAQLSHNRVSSLSGRMRWQDRARALDDERERQRQLATAQAVEAMNVRHAEAAQILQESLALPARALGAKLARMTPQAALSQMADLPWGDLLGLVVKAARPSVDACRLERLARGEPPDLPSVLAGRGGDDVAEKIGANPDALRHLHEALLLSGGPVVDVKASDVTISTPAPYAAPAAKEPAPALAEPPPAAPSTNGHAGASSPLSPPDEETP